MTDSSFFVFKNINVKFGNDKEGDDVSFREWLRFIENKNGC